MIKCTFENRNKASLRHVVVDNLVIDENKILLVKRSPELLNGGKYGLVGGFVERDETSVEASIREIKEETGYDVIPQLLLRIADNPDRPKEDRQNIAFVYVVKVLNKTGEEDKESTETKWFELDNLPDKEQFAFDHYEDIQLYLRYRKEKLQLPVLGKI